MVYRGKLRVLQVDAFTDQPYGGNPAAVVLAADQLDEDDCRRIAYELSSHETVFVSRSAVADWHLRYWTHQRKIGFSGHATVAALHALVEEGMVELVTDITELSLEVGPKVIHAEVVRNESSGLHEVQVTYESPSFGDSYDPKDYAEGLGLSLADILSPNPVQVVLTGSPHLVLPVATRRALERIDPDWRRLLDLGHDREYDGIIVFTRETVEETSDVHLRTFAPGIGVMEDAVSGTAAATAASYVVKHGLMDSTIPVTSIIVEQGYFVGRPGKVFVEVHGDQNEIRQVRVSGTAVTVVEGTILV